MIENIVGIAAIGLPLLLVFAVLLWRRHRPVFLFALALMVVGLGYLWVSGAAEDVGRGVLAFVG